MKRTLGVVIPLALTACGSSSTPRDAATDAPVTDAPATEIHFERHQLDTAYRAEGVGIFDVNGDTHADVVTDQLWFSWPDLAPHAIRTPVAYGPTTEYARGFGAYPLDVNHDGFTDIIAPPHPFDGFYWYENPGTLLMAPDTLWVQHTIAPAMVSGLEIPFLSTDLLDATHPAVVAADSRDGIQTLGYFEPPSDPTAPWALHPVSAPLFMGALVFQHGVGVGDVDSDGHADLLSSYGWFRNPGDAGAGAWEPHVDPNPFPNASNQCARMWTYDVNTDGRADVFCSRPHDHGIYWFEQLAPTADGGAGTAFTEHLIDDTVGEMHALRLADLDHDGTDELISGTRWCALCPSVTNTDAEPAVLVYYAMHHDSDGALTFEKHTIDMDSGVGEAFDIGDVDGDGRPDIATATKKGVFLFVQR